MMQIIALAPLAVFGIFLLVNVIIGLCTGFKKSIARLVAIVASAIIAFIATLIVCAPTSTLVSTVYGLIDGLFAGSGLEEIFAVEELGTSICYYIAMFISPFFFMVAFIVLSIILSIVAAIVIRLIFRDKKPGVLLNRLGGALTGLVCAILITTFILTPIVGTISLASPALELDAVKEEFAEGEELTGNTVIKVFAVTCSPVYNSLASKRFEGKTVYLKNEVQAIVTIVDSLSALAMDMTKYGEEQIEALDTVLEAFDSSPLLKHTVAGILSEAATCWKNGEKFADMAKPTSEEMITPFVDAILEVLSTSTVDTIDQDLGTVKDIFVIMIRSGIFENSGDATALLAKLNAADAINAIFDVIGQNERMSVISDEITKFSVRVLAEALNMPEDGDERYELLMTEIADSLSESYEKPHSERVDAVKAQTKTALDMYGVEVSGGALDQITEALITDLGSRRTVSSSDVKEFFTMYAIAGVQSATASTGNGYDMLASSVPTIKISADGTITVNGVEFRNYHGTSYRKSAAYTMGSANVDFEGASSLYSADAMDSAVITVSDLMASVGKYGDCADIAAETKKVSKIFTRALAIFDEIDFNKVDTTVVMAKLGEFLDLMNSSKVLGEDTTSNMLLAILQCKSIIKPLGISVAESTGFANKISDMVNSGKFDYLHATGIISDTISMMQTAGSFDNKTKEEKIADTKKLIENMSPESAEMLSSLVTPSLVENYGVPTNKSGTVSSTVTSLLDNMANYDGTSEADKKKESEAVSTLLDFTMVASGSKGSLFTTGSGKEGALNTTADDFVELVVTSKVVSKTIHDTVYTDGNTDNPFGAKLTAQDTAEVTNAIENYYDNNGGGEELATQLEAVAIMLNVNVELGQ